MNHLKKLKERQLLLSFAVQVFQIIAFFTLAFIIFYNLSIEWSVFSERDISRAKGWLEGNFHWPGPEMSGGNNLPGPFFYFLLLPAMLFGENIYSQTALWTITWFALTYTAAFFFLSKITSHKESVLIFLVTFILTIFRYNNSFMLNPEFAIMFHVLALIGLYYWREKRNKLYLYLTGLVIALGIQVHLLVGIHIFTVLLFYIIDKSERKNLRRLLLFFLLALSPLLLFTVLKFFNVFETSGNHYGIYIEHILQNVFSEKWLENTKKFMLPFASYLALCSVLTFCYKNKIKNWNVKSSTKNLIIITAVPLLVALLLARKGWYLLFVPVVSILLISKCFDDLMPDNPNKKTNVLLIYILFSLIYFLLRYNHLQWFLNPLNLQFIDNQSVLYVFFLLILIIAVINLNWQKIRYKSILLVCFIFIGVQISSLTIFPKTFSHSAVIENDFSFSESTQKQLYPLMKRICLDTSWSSKKALKKIFIIGVAIEASLLANYTVALEKLKSKSFQTRKHLYKNKATGYFIIQHLQKFINYNKKNWQDYLSQSALLAPVLSQEMKENKIIIQKPTLYNSFWLIPYKTTKNSLFPEGFHNLGQPYYWQEPDWLKKCSQTQSFKNKNGFFYCRVLQGHLQRAGLKIQISENTYKESFLDVQLFGPLLSVITDTTLLDGFMIWSNIQMHLKCDTNSFHWILPDIGGFYSREIFNSKKQAKILLAPLKLRIPLKNCKKNDIKKIKLTFTEKHSFGAKKQEQIIWEIN